MGPAVGSPAIIFGAMDGFRVGILVAKGAELGLVERISAAEGFLDELIDGRSDGPCVGIEVKGAAVGRRDSSADGWNVEIDEGMKDDGRSDNWLVGFFVSLVDGCTVGSPVNFSVGLPDICSVG